MRFSNEPILQPFFPMEDNTIPRLASGRGKSTASVVSVIYSLSVAHTFSDVHGHVNWLYTG